MCPYTSEGRFPAVNVKFYRYNIPHNHNFIYKSFDDSYHAISCECGTIYSQHNFTLMYKGLTSNAFPQYVPMYKCTDCGYIEIGKPHIGR